MEEIHAILLIKSMYFATAMVVFCLFSYNKTFMKPEIAVF